MNYVLKSSLITVVMSEIKSTVSKCVTLTINALQDE